MAGFFAYDDIQLQHNVAPRDCRNTKRRQQVAETFAFVELQRQLQRHEVVMLPSSNSGSRCRSANEVILRWPCARRDTIAGRRVQPSLSHLFRV